MTQASPESLATRAALERFEALFGPVLDDANVLLWLADADADRVVYLNAFCETLWEISREALYANRYAAVDRLHPDDREAVMARFARLEEFGRIETTYRVAMPSGRRRWIRAWAHHVPAADGSPALAVGMLTDVTAQKSLELRLGVKQRLSTLLSDSGELPESMAQVLEAVAGPLGWAAAGLWLCDAGSDALTCRAYWRRSDALTAFEQASRRMVLRAGECLPGRAWASAAPVIAEHAVPEFHYVRRGAAAAAGVRAAAAFPLCAGGRVIGVLDLAGTDGLAHDAGLCELVTSLGQQLSLFLEQRRLDDTVRRESRRLAIISGALAQMVTTKSVPAAARALLDGALEVTGSAHGFVAVVVRGELLRLLAWAGEGWDMLASREFYQSVQRRSTETGTLDFPRAVNLLWSAIAREETVMTDDPGRHPDARTPPRDHPAITSFLAIPLRAGSEVIGELVVANRPGGYTAAERERLEGLGALAGVLCQRYHADKLADSLAEQLRQSQKMEAVGRLAGGVAHDFNNLLQIINGYTEMLADVVHDDEFGRDALDRVRKAGLRAAGLTRQLLSFSRKQTMESRVIDLGTLVKDAQRLFQRLIGEDIRVDQTIAQDLYPVCVDPGQMEQVLMNLLVNARDALPQGGIIRVEVANVRYEAATTAAVPAGAWVRLSVTDNGIGIPAEIQSKVFEPFFTTKDRDRGTGLGLSTVFGIVQQAGGLVRLYSEVGKGTTFHVFLPAHEGAPAAGAEATAAQAAPRASETVLLVEDAEDIRRVVVGMLEAGGYAVIAANDVDDALRLARAHPAPIDLLLTDVVMPSLSGPALADQVRRHRTGVAVLYMSGYSEHDAFPRGYADGSAHLIRKPFDRSSLLVAVRAALLTRASGQLVDAHVGHALVVDDSEVNRELVQRMLESKGFTVDAASGGFEALERLRERQYEVVLLDVTMPDLSGHDVVRRLREQPSDRPWATHASAPVIAITANVAAADRERARAAGMDDLLGKPINLSDLTRTLGTWVPAFQRAIALAESGGEASSEADRIAALKVELGWQNTMRIVTMFLSDMDSKCEAIRGAVEHDDWPALQSATHALRGAAVNLGAGRLADVCRELESLAKLGAVSGVRGHLSHLLGEAARVHDRVAVACGA